MAIPYSSVHTGAGETAEKCSFAATGATDSAGTCPPAAANADAGGGGTVNKPL